jgi:hypothetical protein
LLLLKELLKWFSVTSTIFQATLVDFHHGVQNKLL